jgi:SAM-dependent methyltransferase
MSQHQPVDHSDHNQRTIAVYQDHVQDYLETTPQDMSNWGKDWLNHLLAGLPKTARIIEFGSATGRDAAYIQDQGYTIEATDATPAFVEMMQQRHLDARKLNLLTDPIEGQYDLILAIAVLLHFTPAEMKTVLAKIHAALKPGGTFAFTLKQGAGEEWASHKLGEPRYFCYWNKEDITAELAEAGFSRTDVEISPGRSDLVWLSIIAQA